MFAVRELKPFFLASVISEFYIRSFIHGRESQNVNERIYKMNYVMCPGEIIDILADSSI